MNQDEIKTLLLQVEESQLEFSVTFTGKESKKVNGLYKPETKEILLHNKNFKTDNQLIYTALHEYTHHLMNETELNKTNGLSVIKNARAHNNAFWARFHGLLDKAGQLGLYKLELDEAPELKQLTDEIRTKYLQSEGQLIIDFGKLLIKAHDLCEQANIRYEDYIDRVLQLPRNAAKTIAKIGVVPLKPELGYENMKIVASIPNPDKRNEAQNQLLAGKSPDTVRAVMKKKSEEVDVKTRLEKEKNRLEKTINQLTSRLEMVEESLANL